MTTEAPRFDTTRWSRILQAADPTSPDCLEAFGQLAEQYWRPAYCFVRRSGFGVEDAQDLTQDFFATLLERGYLSRIDPEHWRFRTFLRVALRRFLGDRRDREGALKRGGGRRRVAMDFEEAEARFLTVSGEEPEAAFRREWARSVFSAALDRFRRELEESGRAKWFDVFRRFYGVEEESQSYARIAGELGVSETDIANHLFRARARFREILLDDLREGLSRPEDLEGELRDLFESLGRPA